MQLDESLIKRSFEIVLKTGMEPGHEEVIDRSQELVFLIGELLDENIAFLEHHEECFVGREFQDLVEFIEGEICQCFVKSVEILFDRLGIGVRV